MHIVNSFKYGVAALSVAAAGLAPTLAAAQTSQSGDKWQVSASIYAFVPSFTGTTKFPSPGGDIDVDVLDKLKMAFMGSIDVHNGRWGVFNDFLYVDLGDSKSGTRDFTLGGSIPVGVAGNFDMDLKGTIWTLAGEYRLATGNPDYTIDLLAGTRLFTLKTKLNYAFTGTVASHPLDGVSGTAENSEDLWDGIIGVKGRYAFGQNRQWFMPYYLDIGAGQSDLTWQAAAGVGYKYSWGELTGMWRYLDYNMKSGSVVESLTFNGPMLGATFRW